VSTGATLLAGGVRPRPVGLALVLLLTLVLTRPPVVAAQEGPTATRARSGVRLLEAMEGDALTVVGRIGDIQRLDVHSYSASVWIERIVGTRWEEHEEGTPLAFAWEELATGRPPRFDEGDRALLCLERLSRASIWRERIPDPSVRRQTVGIAMDGDAFLRDPLLDSIEGLHHFLSLSPADRESTTGVGYLLALADSARTPLAVSAAERLADIDDLAEKLRPLGRNGEKMLLKALLRDDVEPDLAPALLRVVEAGANPSLSRELQRATRVRATTGSSRRLFEASARASGGELPESEVDWLMKHADPSYRVIAAQTVSGRKSPRKLRQLLADPAPSVRIAALERLVALGDPEALSLSLKMLADSDPVVRSAAARVAANFGDRGANGLRAVAYGSYPATADSTEAPHSAIGGLAFSGAGGRKTLSEIAKDHPDPAMQKLARIALGELGSSHPH
jgi:hypothetical protein